MIPLQQLFSLSQKPVRERVVVHTLTELVDQPSIRSVLSEPGLQRQLRPVVDQALVGELDGGVLGRQQAGIDQSADDTTCRLWQRCARDDTPQQALAFDCTLIDPNEVAGEGALQGPGLIGCRFRVAQHRLQLRPDGSLHPAKTSVIVEGEAPSRAGTVIERLQRVGQQWQGVGGVDILDDPFREPRLQLEPKPVGRLLDDLGERADGAQWRLPQADLGSGENRLQARHELGADRDGDDGMSGSPAKDLGQGIEQQPRRVVFRPVAHDQGFSLVQR